MNCDSAMQPYLRHCLIKGKDMYYMKTVIYIHHSQMSEKKLRGFLPASIHLLLVLSVWQSCKDYRKKFTKVEIRKFYQLMSCKCLHIYVFFFLIVPIYPLSVYLSSLLTAAGKTALHANVFLGALSLMRHVWNSATPHMARFNINGTYTRSLMRTPSMWAAEST